MSLLERFDAALANFSNRGFDFLVSAEVALRRTFARYWPAIVPVLILSLHCLVATGGKLSATAQLLRFQGLQLLTAGLLPRLVLGIAVFVAVVPLLVLASKVIDKTIGRLVSPFANRWLARRLPRTKFHEDSRKGRFVAVA